MEYRFYLSVDDMKRQTSYNTSLKILLSEDIKYENFL